MGVTVFQLTEEKATIVTAEHIGPVTDVSVSTADRSFNSKTNMSQVINIITLTKK